MIEIPYLPKIELNKAQNVWLREVWHTLLETGNNPKYRNLRLKTVDETGDDFEPSLIDNRLIKERATQITLLGVLHIDPNTKILMDAEKIILTIKKNLMADSDLTDIFIEDIASELNMDKKYAQIVFTLVSDYGSFWSGAGSNSSEGGPFGYERFTINQTSAFDTYIRFKTLPKFIEEYYKRKEEYAERELEIYNRHRTSGIIGSESSSEKYHGYINRELFELSLFEETRGYLKKIANQASLCYMCGLYDASFVMVRKLIETLIIETFERHGLADKIKDNNSHFLFLGDLINAFLNESRWSISRNVKVGLPKLKKFADMSAHNRRFLAKKTDIDKMEDLRIIIEELIHLIDYPNWKTLHLADSNQNAIAKPA